ncbi:hypothetical protein ES703_53730 [subsurface metagenome]
MGGWGDYAADRFPDITFLLGLARAAAQDTSLLGVIKTEVPGTTAANIADLAKERWDLKVTNWGGTAGTATAMAEFVRDERMSLYPWDLEAAVKAALALDARYPGEGYNTQAVSIATVLYNSVDDSEGTYFDSEDTSQAYYVLGLTGAIEAFQEVGLYLDKASQLKALLIGIQEPDGWWPSDGDPSVQDTAYAVMALLRQGESDAVTAAQKGADWLVSSQLQAQAELNGGWYAVGGTGGEYPEVNCEAAWAIYETIQAIGTVDLDHGSDGTVDLKTITIQAAVNAAGTDDTINVAAGTYPESVTIDKSLTLLGAKAGVDARTRTFTGESILDGTGLAPVVGVGAFNILDGVSDVIIDGFEVCNYQSINPGGGSAVLAYSYGAATQGLSQITIQNNYMHDLGWNGVCVWSNNGVIQDDFTIQFNLIEEAPYAGIELTNVINSKVLNNKIIAPTDIIASEPDDAGVGIEIAVRAHPGFTITAGTNVLVEGNEISGTFPEGSRAGINILSRTYASDSVATLTGVTVRGNTVSASVIVGILAVAESRDDGPATISNLQIVDDNIVSNFTKSGIVVRDVLSVQIEGNIISTTNHSVAPNGIDIGATTGTTGTVKGNQISGCHWDGYDPEAMDYEGGWTGSGILVIAPASTLTISGNEVQNCDVGMDIEAGPLTLITNNNVHDNSYGFVFWNAGPTINFNNIYQNALGGIPTPAAGFVKILSIFSPKKTPPKTALRG